MRSATFSFNYMFVNPIKFTGAIDYEWIDVGEKHLVIHAVKFDRLQNAEVKKMLETSLYLYLVERAKAVCTFA